MASLTHQSLHASVHDSSLASVRLLNEIMSRYPDAISFAPGAPNPAFMDEVDPGHLLGVYLAYLRDTLGVTERDARRSLYEYGPSKGLINGVIAEALARDGGATTGPESIVITVGAQEAILLTLRALFRTSNDILAVPAPCYVGVIGAARFLDIDLIGVQETMTGLDLDELDRVCRRELARGRRVRALYVAPDHANPSGALFDLDCRRQLINLAKEHSFLLLEDSTYRFTEGPDALPTLKQLDDSTSVIHLGTFAKICAPGARVGYVVADQAFMTPSGARRLADELAGLKTMSSVNTSPFSQAMVAGMLIENGGSIAALANRKAALYQRNLTVLLNALDHRLDACSRVTMQVHWNRPTGGFFVRVSLAVEANEVLLERCASRYGVLWTPMAPFYVDGGGRQEIRLSCSYLEPQGIEQGVERLACFLEDVHA